VLSTAERFQRGTTKWIIAQAAAAPSSTPHKIKIKDFFMFHLTRKIL